MRTDIDIMNDIQRQKERVYHSTPSAINLEILKKLNQELTDYLARNENYEKNTDDENS